MLKKLILFVFLLVLVLSELNARSQINIDELSRTIYVKEMDQYVDSTSSLTYTDFQSRRELFYKSNEDLQGTRNRAFTYWMTFILKGDLLKQENFYLLCMDSRISLMETWINGEPQTDSPIGADFLFSNRDINHRSLVYKLPQEDELEVLIKIKSNQASFFAFEVKSENSFLRDSFWETALIGGSYGAIIFTMFFSLFMRLRFKENIYIAYAFYAFISILTCLFLDGGGYQHFWSSYPKFNLFLLICLPILVLISCGALVLSFLETWDSNDRYCKLVVGTLLFSILGYVFAFTIPQYYIHNIIYMVPLFAMIYSCVAKYREGYKSVFIFIVGFISVVITNSLYMLQPFISAEHYPYLIRFTPHLGVLALMFSLGYSQYMKFFYISESRKAERKKSIIHLEQLNRIKDGINEEIAEKVAQQTQELEHKNAIIHNQNAELQYAHDKLKAQTDEIVNLNLKLNQENLELKSDVEKITESRILQNTVPFDDFKEFFASDETCFVLLEELKWRNGYKCMKCKNSKYGKGKGEKARRCTKCGTNESVTSNTIFHRLHFPIHKGFYILFLVNKHGDNLISKDISEIVDLRLATCWKFGKKVKARKIELEQSGKILESWMDLI